MERGVVSAVPAVKQASPLDAKPATSDPPNETSSNSFASTLAPSTASDSGRRTEKYRPAGRITFGALGGFTRSGAADAGKSVKAFNTKMAAAIKAGDDL
jgi:hypothetical protein